MEFCSKCGSFMAQTRDGYVCRKCGNVIKKGSGKDFSPVERVVHSSSVYVVDNSEPEAVKVARVCPRCGNVEAFRSYSGVSGEHAGVSRDRTVEHYQCAKCHHKWAATA